MGLALVLLSSAVTRTFVVGDVHGCIDELEELLREAAVGPADTLVLAGDLVAKGPDSQAVVQLARERQALSVRGNHDAHVLKARAGRELKKQHAKVARSLSEDDWRYLEAAPSYLEVPAAQGLIVHAGLLPGVALPEQPYHLLLNLRSFDEDGEPSTRVEGTPWAARWTGPQFVVFGHDAVRGLQRHPFALGLDTGCVYGRKLTGVWLEERRLVSVPAHRVWEPPGD